MSVRDSIEAGDAFQGRRDASRRGVIGIVARDGGEYLVVRRAAAVRRGGCWCFPGGHIERGENSRVAIIREMMEELSLPVRPVRRLGAVRLLDSGYVLVVWLLESLGGCPTANPDEVAEARWLTIEGIRELSPTLPSNEEVLAMLER
jgi:8-oxo-dGTP pyrophosphatase MutT (NUDIX family)